MEPISAESMVEFVNSWGYTSHRQKDLQSRYRHNTDKNERRVAENVERGNKEMSRVNAINSDLDRQNHDNGFEPGTEYIKSLEGNI